MQFTAKAVPALIAGLVLVAATAFLPRLAPDGALVAQQALAQEESSQDQAEEETAEDPVVARVNGEEIYRSDVMESAATLPQQYQAQIEMLFPMLVDRLVDLHLLTEAADAADLEDDPVVEERLNELKREVIRDVYLERFIEDAVSEEDLRAAYETYLAQNPPRPEIKARHILLEKESEAEDTIEALAAGADFAELASERSQGPSAAQGGDLGWFGEGRMVEAFSDAAFALEPGTYTEEPVKTQFGWHVIKVEERREIEPESFEEMESELRQEIARNAVQDLLETLREEAEVEILVEQQAPDAGLEQPPIDGDGDME